MGQTEGQDKFQEKEDQAALKEELDFLMKELKALGKTGEDVAEATGYAHGTLRTAKSSGTNLKYIVAAVRSYYEEVKQKAANYAKDKPMDKGFTSSDAKELYDNNVQQLKEEIQELREKMEEVLKAEAETQKRLTKIEDMLLSIYQKESANQSTTGQTTAGSKSSGDKTNDTSATPDN